MTLDFGHPFYHFQRCRRVTNAPTGHGIRFGKPIDYNRSFLQVKIAGNAYVLAVIVNELFVNFV